MTAPATPDLRSAGGPSWSGLLSRHAMLVAAVICCASLFVVTSPVFGTPGNAANILRQSASVLMLGLAMTLVVLVGGIDLSVGSVVLASATLAGIGLAEGLPSGRRHPDGRSASARRSASSTPLLVEGLRISPVIVTLGTMIAVRGLSLVALGRYNSWVEIKGPIFDDLARRTVVGIPLDALVAIVAAAIALVRAAPHDPRPRAACSRRCAGRRAARRPARRAAARHRLCRLRRAGRRRRRAGRGAHRADQPLDRRRAGILRDRRRGARRRRPARRTGQRRPDASSAC